MATLSQIAAALRKADEAGDVEAAKRLARAYREVEGSISSMFEPPKKQAGFIGSFKDAVTSLGLADEAAAYAANPTEENRQEFLKKAESKYKSVGGFGKGDNWEAFKELLGGSLGALVAPIVGGVAGAAAGPLGGIAGFAGTSASQYSIANLRRQAEQQQAAAEAGEAVPELSLGKAAAASLAQAGLDVVPGALILKGLSKFPVAQRLLTKDETSSKAAQVLIDAFNKGNLSLKGNVVKGVGLGVAFEVPQEIAQQALERWQAGLPLDDDEAKEEFKQAAIGAALLGGGFGAIGGAATYRAEQGRLAEEAAAKERERAEIEQSIFGAPPVTDTGIPADFYAADEERRGRELEESIFGAIPTETGIPADMLETEAEREARLEREAIQAEGELGAAPPAVEERRPYSARTLREAAEAEALAPRDEDEGAPYIPPAAVEPEFVERTESYEGLMDERSFREQEEAAAITADLIEQEKADIQEAKDLLTDIDKGEVVINPAQVSNVARNLGVKLSPESTLPDTVEKIRQAVEVAEAAPITMPGILTTRVPAREESTRTAVPTFEEFLQQQEEPEYTMRDAALEVIKTTPTIKAVAEATGLNQPQAAALMRQFVDEGLLERKGSKFKFVTPELTAQPEATDVSGATVTTTETDSGAGRGSPDLFTLGPPAGELGAPPTRGAGLAATGDVTERVDDREADVSPTLEADLEGLGLEGFGAPTETGLPPRKLEGYLAERQKVRDLKDRAVAFIRETGKGSATELQAALNIPLSQAKTLRSALLGSGQVVQKTNVKAAKTAGRSYFVVEGDYTPSGRFAPRETTAPEARQEAVAETGVEELGLEGAPAETGLPPDMLDSYFTEQRLEEARQRATGKLRGEGVESEAERIQREADRAAELTPAKPKVTVAPVPEGVLSDEVRRAFSDLEAEGNAQKIAKLDEAIARVERQASNKKLTKEERAEQNRLANTLKSERQQAVSQQGLDLVGGKGRPTLSSAEQKMLDEVKSAARFLVQQGKMSLDQVNKFNAELRKAAPDVGKLRKMVDDISTKESDIEVEEQQDLDESGFIISDNFKEDADNSAALSDERGAGETGRPRAGRPLDFNEQIVYFRNKALNRFKKRKSLTKGLKADTVRSLIGKITAGWKNPPNFIVVQSHLDLPQELDPEANEDSMGVAVGNDVYIIADNIRLPSDLKATVFHESLGHYGLEQLFGERLLQTMLDIYNTNNRVRADADAWLEENPDVYPESEFTQDERRALATEEVFAEMSEGGPIADSQYRAAFNRVAALIRKFARALSQLVGRDVAYSNREIQDIIAQAHNKVITGKTRLVPRYNNIRYMKKWYNRTLTNAMGQAQNAPEATREILTGTVDSLSNVPNSLRNAKLATFSMHHMMQLFEKYAPAFRALNNLVERKAYDSTREMVEFTKQASKYREVLRNNSQFVDEFNKVAHLINLSQAPVLEEQVNVNGDFVRFVPNVASQRMRNIPANSAAYSALTPDEKVLHEAVNRFYALPTDVQQVIADIYTDYRNYSDNAFKIKLTQLMNRLPANIIAGIKANFQNNRLKFYLPLPREGMYKLVYLDNNGIRVSQLFDSMAGRDNAEKQVRAQGMTVLDEPKVLRQRNYGDSNLPPGLLKELLENVQDSLTRAGVAAADIENAKETVFDTFVEFMPGAYGNDLRQEISSRKTFLLNGTMYYGRLGYDEDVMAAYEKRIPGIIYQINNLKYTMPFEKVRKLIKEQLNTYRANKGAPAYAGLPDLDDPYLESLREDLDSRVTFAKKLQQYSPYVYTISKANYIYSIALNISSALINTTILPMMAWPTLAAKYGPVNASRAVGQAIQLFFKHSYRDPQTGRLNFDYKRLADMPASFGGDNMPAAYAQTAHGREFNRFFRTLLARSVVGTAAEQELIQAENITVPGYEGLSAKVNLAMSYVFRSSERMNREVTALAAYMLARNIDVDGQAFDPNRQGVSVGKASEEAIRLNYDVNGATTPETNSRLYQTDIGRIALTFRTHALNMILNLAFSFNQAIETINAGQPNEAERRLVRSIARKKLLYIFGSTYMLAGIKGLPLFGAAEVLASLLMGDDDEPYDLEQIVLDSVGTLGLNGPVNELLNVDIASRTGFYGLLWRDDPKRLAEVGVPVYILERLAGPTYGLVEAARRGFNDLADGELVRASEALTPAPIRNMIKGMRYGIEGAQTRDGLPIVEDVNAYNSMMQVLGFAPADLAVAQAQRGATYQVSEKLKNRRVALLTNLYAARKADNTEAMEKAFEDIRKFNEANPSYRITGDTISKSYKERERRAREAIMGVYQPRNLRIATSEYVTDLNAEDEDAFF